MLMPYLRMGPDFGHASAQVSGCRWSLGGL